MHELVDAACMGGMEEAIKNNKSPAYVLALMFVSGASAIWAFIGLVVLVAGAVKFVWT